MSNPMFFDQPRPPDKATKSDEFIKSSVENLIPIPSESEGILEHMYDVPFHDNSSPLDVSKDRFEDFSKSNDEFSSIDDSFSIDNIDYVEASPPDSELVSSEVMEIVIPEVGGIDDDILLTIKDNILRENLLNVNHLFAKIEALNDIPTPFYNPIISGTPPTLTPSGESDFFLEKVDAFLAVEDEPTSSQFPKSYLNLEGDILLLEAFLNDDHSFDFKTKVDLVPNKQSSASIRTNPITNSQRHVIVKENVSSDTVTASSTGLVHTAKTRSPQPKGNTRNVRVPSASKSSKVKKIVTVRDHRRTLLLSKNRKTMSSECNNIKLAIQNDKSEIVCDTSSYDDQSCSNEDVPEKIFSTLLFEEEIIPMKMDQHYYNAESDLMESLYIHDSSFLISSKIDSLLDEFAGELTFLKSILPGIDETDCDVEEDIRLIER
nr:hypothetical protein [Tanacetum cinerariifolium]